MKKLLWGIALSLFIFGDILTTYCGFYLGAIETNPVATQVVSRYGIVGVLSVKIVISIVLVGIAEILDTHYVGAISLIIVSSGIVGTNLYVIILLI